MDRKHMHIAVGDLFTDEQLRLACTIIDSTSGSERQARLIEEVVKPAMEHINTVTRQENEPAYLAHILTWVLEC